MKILKSSFLIFILSLLVFSCNHKENTFIKPTDSTQSPKFSGQVKKSYVGKDGAEYELALAIKYRKDNFMSGKVLIKDTNDLISIAEPILFNIFGKEAVIDERPY